MERWLFRECACHQDAISQSSAMCFVSSNLRYSMGCEDVCQVLSRKWYIAKSLTALRASRKEGGGEAQPNPTEAPLQQPFTNMRFRSRASARQTASHHTTTTTGGSRCCRGQIRVTMSCVLSSARRRGWVYCTVHARAT